MTAWCNGAWVRSDTGVGLVEAVSRGIVALFCVEMGQSPSSDALIAAVVAVVVAVNWSTALSGGERGDGILATVGVGNSPLGKIASPQDGSAAVWGTGSAAVGVVAVDWLTASSCDAVDRKVCFGDGPSPKVVNAWAVAGTLGAVA